MFSSPVAYEGLDSFLKSDKTGVSVIRNGNSSDDSQPDPAYGYATANSSPVVETRVRSRSYPNKQRAFVSSEVPKDCPTYEGVCTLSSFGRPLSKLSTNANVTSFINTPEQKMPSFQHYEMDDGLNPAHTSGGRDSQCSGGSGRSSGVAAAASGAAALHQATISPANKATAGAMQRNLPNTAVRANSHDNILSVSPFSNTTSRVNPSVAAGQEFDSATLGRRSLGFPNNNIHRTPQAVQNRINPHQQQILSNGGSPSIINNHHPQHSTGEEPPEEMFMKFPHNGTVYVPPAGDDRVQYIKGAAGGASNAVSADEYELASGLGGGSIIWPSNITRSSRYAQNGAPQYRPNSVHDYQPLAPFQENPHLPPISTMGTAPGQNSKSVYDAHDDENYCINWKCIITLCCILALLIIGLLFLLTIKFFYVDNSMYSVSRSNDHSVILLNDYKDKLLEISVAPRSSRMLSVYAMGPILLTLHIKTSSSRLVVYGLEGAEPYATNFTFIHELSALTPQFDSNSRVLYTSSFASEDMKTVHQYLSNGKWYIRVFNDGSGYEMLEILTKWEDDKQSICPADCNSPQGECNAIGYCVCKQQFQGAYCDRPSLKCGTHGRLVRNGNLRTGVTQQACKCDPGWTGSLCDQSETGCYPPDCSGNGQCEFGTCHCNPGFVGHTCNHTMCSKRCNDNGICVNNNCVCALGFYGENCQSKKNPDCDSTCVNGDCIYGHCQCRKGFRGSTCRQKVCENNCSGNGICVANENAQWSCRCNVGWTGANCEAKMQPACLDICKTNPACCKADRSCLPPATRPQMCQVTSMSADKMYSNKDIQSSFNHRTTFLEKTSFLFREQTGQRTLPFDLKDKRYVFVVRGQIIHGLSRQPYLGALIYANNHENLGHTNTQHSGWFDFLVATDMQQFTLLVNYTGMPSGLPEWKVIHLNSKKNDFVTLVQPIVIDDISWKNCPDSLSKLPVFSTSIPYFLQSSRMQSKFDHGAVVTENYVTKSFSPDIQFPKMVFNSHMQGSKRVTIYLGNFKEQPKVEQIYVTITIAGLVFTEVFDNHLDELHWDIFWNKTDIYGNKVYGLTEVEASIDYKVSECSNRFWANSVKTQIEALSCHESITYEHHYCLTHTNSLYSGKGHAFHFNSYPPVRRHMQCLTPPKVIEALPNGDILIGDNSQIFHVHANKIGARCELNRAVYSFGINGFSEDLQYFIAADPSAEFFYLTRSDSPVIIRVNLKNAIHEVIMGQHSKKCVGNYALCYDSLKSPKGLTVLNNGTVVFVDGLALRSWTPGDDAIQTLWAPSSDFMSPHKTCSDIPANKVILQQLKNVKHNPTDDTFILFDYSRSVVKLNLRTQRMSFLATRAKQSCKWMNTLSVARVYYPFSVTVGSKGDIFLADSDPLNKRTTVYRISPNNQWEVFWHQDQMQILSQMTITANDTLLMINDQEKRVDILGRYQILSEENKEITDYENNRIIRFNDQWLHESSDSYATSTFTRENFYYYQENTALKTFMQNAGSERLFLAIKQDFWEVKNYKLTGYYSDWQNSVLSENYFDNKGVITRFESNVINRYVAMLDYQLVELLVNKRQRDDLQNTCVMKSYQNGQESLCTEGADFGVYTQYTKLPSGDDRITFEDNSFFTLSSTLPGMAQSASLESSTSDGKYSLKYLTKDEKVYALQLSSNHQILMEKLFRFDKSLIAFGPVKEPLTSFQIDSSNSLPSKVVSKTGQTFTHSFEFSNERRLTSIESSSVEDSLFFGKYDKDSLFIDDTSYSLDAGKGQIQVTLMGMSDDRHTTQSLYNLTYEEDSKFVLSTNSVENNQRHTVFSFSNRFGEPTTSVFHVFAERYAYKTHFNSSTKEMKTYDGLKRVTTLKFDYHNRLSKILYRDTDFIISYPLFFDEPNKYTQRVSSKVVAQYSNNLMFTNYTYNRATGSQWLFASYSKMTGNFVVNLRQQWGALIKLQSRYSPFTLKSSTHSSKDYETALTFTDSDGLDVTHVFNKLEQGFNEKFGPNRFQETTFYFHGRQVLQLKTSDDSEDSTFTFSVRSNDQETKTYSYAVGLKSVEHCGKVVQDPVSEQFFLRKMCRAYQIIHRSKNSYSIEKKFSIDGRLEAIVKKSGSKEIQVLLRFDDNGFISQLGDKTFKYNPLGQLIEAKTKTDVAEYMYDIQGRLTQRHLSSNGGSETTDHAYFYLDSNHPSRISQILVGSKDEDPKVYEIYYDYTDKAIVMKYKEKTYLVANTPVGTAKSLYLLDKVDQKVTEAGFPEGVKLSLKGSWLDETFGLVYLNHRFFHLETYTYLDLDLRFLQQAFSSPFQTKFTTYLNDHDSFWPEAKFSEIGAFKTFMPELWFNSSIQRILQESERLKSKPGTIQTIPSMCSFSNLFDNLILTPLIANLPTIQPPHFVEPLKSSLSAILNNRLILPPFNQVLYSTNVVH